MTASRATAPQVSRPPRLQKGATLGVIATSSPIDEAGDALVERGCERLRDKGFEVVEAPNCRTHRGHAAGTIEERVDALHAFFADPDIDGIISFWGGMQTHQLLEYLDWGLIAANPRPLGRARWESSTRSPVWSSVVSPPASSSPRMTCWR